MNVAIAGATATQGSSPIAVTSTPAVFATGSATQSGVASAPTAGTAVATMAAGSLPAGTYAVSIWVSIAGTTSAAADANNMNVKAGATSLIANLPFDTGNAGATTNGGPYSFNHTFDGATNLTVNAVGNATAGSSYSALIVATRIA